MAKVILHETEVSSTPFQKARPKTYRDTMSRMFAKQSLDLFRNLIIDFRLRVLPPRMDLTLSWASHRLPTFRG